MISKSIYPQITEAMVLDFKATWLYIKRHKLSGLLYFGKTINDPYKYNGSGTYWRCHINKHGKEHIETMWCKLFDDIYELVHYALTFSKENDIVASDKWANLVPENGLGVTAEQCKVISEAAKNRDPKTRKQTPESNQKRSVALKGKKKDRLAVEKQANAQRGQIRESWGSHTDEAKEKIGAVHSGKPKSEEHCKNISKSLLKPCTVDGITIYPSRTALIEALGQGKNGTNSPFFRYV